VRAVRYNADGTLDTTFGKASGNTLGGFLGYTENTAPVALDPSVAIFDADLAVLAGGAGNYGGASITVSRAGGADAQDVFSGLGKLTLFGVSGDAMLSGLAVGSFVNSHGMLSLTFNSSATQARVNEVLSSIGYANTSDAPPSRVVINYVFSDGNSGAQGAGSSIIVSDSVEVYISPVNDAPFATNLSAAESYTEDTALNLTKIVITDVDSANVTAKLTLSNNAAGALSTDTSGSVTSTYNAATGVWSASGALADVNTLLAGVTFTPRLNFNANFTVATSVSDGVAPAITGIKSFAGSAVDDEATGTLGVKDASEEGGSLVAALTAATDADGGITSTTYQWQISTNRSTGWSNLSTGATLNLASDQSQVGQYVRVVATTTDPLGGTTDFTGAALAVVNVNDAPTGGVTITGTAVQGQTLTAGNTLADADGLGTVSYQWSADGVAIAGGTNNTLVLGQSEVGKNISVKAGYTDSLGTAESVDSSATVAVVNVNDAPTGGVTITGMAKQGQTLSANNTLADVDGLGTISYQWSANGVAIAGATASTLVLGAAEVGKAISVAAIYTDQMGASEGVASSATGVVIGLGLTLTGTARADALNGGAFDDTLYGLAGADTLNGGAGNDTMDGGTGNDTYVLDSAGDVVVEAAGAGTDLVQSSVSYTLGANVENLTLTGSAAINATGNQLANTLRGNSGNNVLDGGAGADKMIGGAGDDTYVVDNAGDAVTEAAGEGSDTVISSLAAYTLGANVENFSLAGIAPSNGTGNTLANTLTGNDAANVLSGLAGNDVLNGGAGNDTLIGGAGNDALTGGLGSDVFQFGNFALNASTNLDTVFDFTHGVDSIQLENAIFKKLTATGTLSAANFHASNDGTPVDANDYIQYNAATGALYYDADGSGAGAAIQFATLIGAPAITAADFMVI
jgi:Ca2+-binding RTX toxin-like protein